MTLRVQGPHIANKNFAFTMVELLLVVMIVLILSAIAMPNYVKAKERALTREAKANLKLIVDAERVYNFINGGYYPSSGTATTISDINTNLRLNIGEANWDYYITKTASFTAYADRQGTGSYSGCIYYIDNTMNEPATSTPASCP